MLCAVLRPVRGRASALVVVAQNLGQAACCRHDHVSVDAAWLTAHALDGPGD